MTPISRRNYPDKIYQIGEKGVNKASVFNGFCQEHEKLFFNIDNEGIISEKRIISQAFRSLSYIVFGEELGTVYRPYFDEKILKEKRFLTSIQEIDIFIKEYINKYLNEKNSKIDARLKRWMKYKENLNKILLNMPDNNIHDSDFHPYYKIEHQSIELFIAIKKLNYKIPVAINAKLTIKVSDTNKEEDLFLICIPYYNSTDVILMFDKKNGSIFTNKLDYYFSYDINLLNLIETMIISTEFWWLSPDIYNTFSNEKKKIINEDLYCLNTENILGDYDISLFDSLRINLIKNLSFKRQKYEENKIIILPKRENFLSRKERMDKKMAESI
jgi:hypothetical protein